MTKNLQSCNNPICSFVINEPNTPILISFSIYDTNENELIESFENSEVFVKGISQNANIVYVMDARVSTNIGYGVPDILGNFNIPINIVGTDIDQATTIIVMVM